MNCDSVRRLLALADDDARADLAALALHFRDCGFCRREFPEVFALIASPESVTVAPTFVRRRRDRARWHDAAAAALLLVAFGLASRSSDRELATNSGQAPAPDSSASLDSIDHAYTVTYTDWVAGRPITSRLERRSTHLNPARTAR